MRVLQFNNYADPLGGAEVYALALARELTQRGHDVLFFGTSPDRGVEREDLHVVQRPRYDPALLMRDAAVSRALEDRLERFRPGVVHVHNVHALGIDVLLALRNWRGPIVQTVHDFSLVCPNSWCVRGDGTVCQGGVGDQCFRHDCQKNYPFDAEVALHTLLKHRTLAGIVDVAITPSVHLAERMQASGYRDVRHRNYFLAPIATEAAERKAKELVYIGRLEPEKGVDTLLDAMPGILAADPEVHLTIIGGGALSSDLRSRATVLGLEPRVTFLSHVPRAELGSFYATATACVIPSIWSENSPLVAYECMAAGLPMIASRIGGIPELVEEGRAGFTFRPRDSADLAERALRLLRMSAQERDQISEWMRQRAARFGAEEHVTWVEDVYDELVRRGAPARAPAVPIDRDLLAILEHYGSDKARLGKLFHEHVGYIRHLERTLAERSANGVVEGAPSLLRDLQRSLDHHKRRLRSLAGSGPANLWKRLARALPRAGR